MNRQGPGKIDWTDGTINPIKGIWRGPLIQEFPRKDARGERR